MAKDNIPDNIIFGQTDDFSVNVRNTEPMLKVGERKVAGKASAFFGDVVSAAVLTAALSLFIMMSETPALVPWTLAAAVVFIGLTALWRRFGERTRLISSIILIVVLIAVLIIMRKYIGNGLALIVNSIYDMAEEAQAYVYNRFTVGSKGDNSPDLCMITATVWVSVLAGFLAALPGERFRLLVNTLIVVGTMMVFAYFGMIPSWIAALVLVAAFLASVNKGRINSSWPLILAVMLVFGAVIMLDPGENYAVSRANENLRDRFAFHTSYIEGMDEPEPELEEEQSGGIAGGIRDFISGDTEEESTVRLLIVIAVPFVIIAAAMYLIHRRLAAKRKKVRAGIDSKDPAAAIGAMFPYAVKWLRPCGISTGNAHFSELTPGIREVLADEYAGRYEKMLALWMEAVYSDHEMTEECKNDMSAFMKDTIAIAKKKADWKERLRIRFKYAL